MGGLSLTSENGLHLMDIIDCLFVLCVCYSSQEAFGVSVSEKRIGKRERVIGDGAERLSVGKERGGVALLRRGDVQLSKVTVFRSVSLVNPSR